MNFLDWSKLIQFFQTDVWMIRTHELSRVKAYPLRLLRIVLLTIRGVKDNQIPLRASALTFYTLLSIVPLLAMIFGIAKGFGVEKLVEQQLMERMPGQEEVVTKIINFSHSLLETTQGGLIAGVGLALLFGTVIRLLGKIEIAFNKIWGIQESRSLSRKFSDYLSILLISPILLIMSSSLTVFLTTQLRSVSQEISFFGVVTPFIFFLLWLLPYAVIWGLFTLVYIILPNTSVRVSSAFLGGVVAGTAYQIAQWAYLTFQVGVSRYNAIYGSFAALPLFLIWLHISWLIVLYGAEVSFAYQNVGTFEREPGSFKISTKFKRLLSLLVTHTLVKDFSQGNPARTAPELSNSLEIPLQLCRQILQDLVVSGILSEVKTQDEQEWAYQPAQDIHRITVGGVLEVLDRQGIDDIPMSRSQAHQALSQTMAELDEEVKKSQANRLLADL